METLERKVARVLEDRIEVVAHDPKWFSLFEAEKAHLLACLPTGSIGRVEHFGSTAVPGLDAKPVVDMLVEVADARQAWETCAPILEAQGYDAFWRPSFGDDVPPFYPWFIKRDDKERRTHHIHMVEPDFEHWERLRFRDELIARPDLAREYARLKRKLAAEYPGDRVAYTAAKGEFIARVMRDARQSRG